MVKLILEFRPFIIQNSNKKYYRSKHFGNTLHNKIIFQLLLYFLSPHLNDFTILNFDHKIKVNFFFIFI